MSLLSFSGAGKRRKRRNPGNDTQYIFPSKDSGTEYAITRSGERISYTEAAHRDLEEMRKTGKYSGLYLVKDEVTNWPGTLRFKTFAQRSSSASAYGRRIPRTDAWFILDGYVWHCVSKGDMDLARCRRTKQRAPGR